MKTAASFILFGAISMVIASDDHAVTSYQTQNGYNPATKAVKTTSTKVEYNSLPSYGYLGNKAYGYDVKGYNDYSYGRDYSYTRGYSGGFNGYSGYPGYGGAYHGYAGNYGVYDAGYNGYDDGYRAGYSYPGYNAYTGYNNYDGPYVGY